MENLLEQILDEMKEMNCELNTDHINNDITSIDLSLDGIMKKDTE